MFTEGSCGFSVGIRLVLCICIILRDIYYIISVFILIDLTDTPVLTNVVVHCCKPV